MRNAVVLTVALVVLFATGASGRAAPPQAAPTVIKGGKLDLIKLYVERFPSSASAPVVIRPFATDGTSVGLGAAGGRDDAVAAALRIVKEGPGLLANGLIERLKKIRFLASVSRLDGSAAAPPQAIVVEGKFVTLDPGDSHKRKMVGMGSGKTTVAVEGVIKDASGKTLVEFYQERFGAKSRGDSINLLISDATSIGEDIANFLDAWAKGKSIK